MITPYFSSASGFLNGFHTLGCRRWHIVNSVRSRGARKQNRTCSQKNCGADCGKESSRSHVKLKQPSSDVGSEDSAEPPDTQHHANRCPSHFRIVRSGGEIVQNVLAAKNAESRGAHENDIQRMNVYQGEHPDRDCSSKPPNPHGGAIISGAVRKEPTNKRTDKRHELDQRSEAEAHRESSSTLHHCRWDPASQSEDAE